MRVFLNSLLILFLELVLIRFLPGHILYLGYFTNFVLIASFLGIGLGFLLGRSKTDLVKNFPFLLLVLVGLSRFFATSINTFSNEVIFFRGSFWYADVTLLPSYILLPLLFCLISAVFACLSQPLAKLFAQSKLPLRTYVLDIMGSIAGIITFSIISYFALPPWVWFTVFLSLFLLLFRNNRPFLFLSILIFVLIIGLSVDYKPESEDVTTVWSPYQKIDVLKDPFHEIWVLYVNNVKHQTFSDSQHAPEYKIIFSRITQSKKIKNALVIGSGTGQDLAAALAAGIEHIDAVEIDPQILATGKSLHPEKPYSNPRVTATLDDGRDFLHNSKKKYDLIVYALTDSLILASGRGNIRLENYLFTTDAFQEVREHLNQGGLLITYNDYRENWLVSRLLIMMKSVFGTAKKEPLLSPTYRMLVAENNNQQIQQNTSSKEILPTDDWPFFYLKKNSIPTFYLYILAIISVISVVSTFLFLKFTAKKITFSNRLVVFFLLGAAFSLIETKSIVQLNLLFGATWLVSGLAFLGILVSVLLACLVTYRFRFPNLMSLFVLLIISLLIQYVLPVKMLLLSNFWLRLGLSATFFFLPIFFANLIFANLFARSKSPELDFGSNLLGLVLGGVVEYAALITGYSALAIIAAAFYFAAFLIFWKINKEGINTL